MTSRNAKKTLTSLKWVFSGIALFAIAIGTPLFTVWKEVCITRMSKENEALIDSLAVVQSQLQHYRLVEKNLSSIERIEQVGRDILNLEYPPSDHITIVRIREGTSTGWHSRFGAHIQRFTRILTQFFQTEKRQP